MMRQAFDKQDCQGFKALILFAAPTYSERIGIDVLLPKLGPQMSQKMMRMGCP